MDYMVSADDFKKIVPNVKIIRFPELAKYNNINQVLPHPTDCAIIFLIDEQTPTANIGHWTCIMKSPFKKRAYPKSDRMQSKFEFFDSYGLSPSGDLSHIPMADRERFKENHDYLKELIGSKLRHNPIDYQSWGNGINTCGRFTLIRILAFMAGITDAKQFYKFMKNAKKEYGCKSFDELAVKLTSS